MTVMSTVERPCAIRQVIATGNNFGDDAPLGVLTFANDTFKFASHTTGGRFDPTDSALYAFERLDALVLLGIELKMANQTTWKVELKDVDGGLTILASGTTELSYIRGSDDPIVLLWGSQVVITTTGSPTGMIGTVKLAPYKVHQGHKYPG